MFSINGVLAGVNLKTLIVRNEAVINVCHI